MIIEVNRIGNKQYIATVKDEENVIFTSNKHQRPGCASRDAINYINFKFGGEASFIKFDLKEWV